MRTKLKLLIIFICIIFPIITNAQTVISVSEGTDQIAVALESAMDGDIIELVTSGGTYNETNRTMLDKFLTIRAADGLSEKPIWTTDDTLAIIELGNSLNITGIHLNGEMGANRTQNGIAVSDSTFGYTLIAEDCMFWGFGTENYNGFAIEGTYRHWINDTTQILWHAEADAIGVNNCMFGGTGAIIDFSYPLRMENGGRPEGACLEYYIINSTFWGQSPYSKASIYASAAVDYSDSLDIMPSPIFWVDHCTFVGVGDKGIYARYIDGAVIKNSMMVSNEDKAFRIHGGNSSASNILWWDCPGGVQYQKDAPEGTNILNEDPMFMDTRYLFTGDFRLPESSPATGQSDLGSTLGDPRWWTGSTTTSLWPGSGGRMTNITFQVDMSDILSPNYAGQDTFYSGGDVWISFGDWESWETMVDPDSDSIYTVTVELEEGQEIKYFYGYQTGADDNTDYVGETIPTDCSDDGYRTIIVPIDNITIPPVIYGSCTGVIPDGIDITDIDGTYIIGSNDDFPWEGATNGAGSPDGEKIPNLIDNDYNTKYLVRAIDSWAEIGLDTYTKVTGYTIVSANDAPERDPKSWLFQGWNANSEEWETIHSVPDNPMWLNRLMPLSWIFENNKTYKKYRLHITEINGDSQSLMQIAELQIWGELSEPSAIDDQENMVKKFTLQQNYPNPFNPKTTIAFELPRASEVNISVFNLLGENLMTLINQKMKAGYHTIEWNATDLPTGIYLYKIEAGNFTDVKKSVLLK